MKAMSANTERIIEEQTRSLGKAFYKHRTYSVQSHIGQNETDCISCNKHIHSVPNKKICKLLCGITKQQTRSNNI